VILLPHFPLIKMILLSQVINGVLLPFVLIFMTILVEQARLMQEWTNSRFYTSFVDLRRTDDWPDARVSGPLREGNDGPCVNVF